MKNTTIMLLSSVVLLLLLWTTAVSGFNVSIHVNYTPPLTFDLPSPYYRAGSPIFLTCEVDNDFGTVAFYQWRSTCTRNCFPLDIYEKVASTDYLQSSDSGLHICEVHSIYGDIQSANVTVNVVSAGIYDSTRNVALPNNSLILIESSGSVVQFLFVSGSTQRNVGHFIGLNNTDITWSYMDNFIVARSGPGTLRVRTHSLRRGEQGIYTCRIPDEMGKMVDVNIGLYINSFASAPVVSSLEHRINQNSEHSLVCTTTGSPPTSVTWTRNGTVLTNSMGMNYSVYQILTDRRSSTYESIITFDGNIAGEYGCSADNVIGSSNTTTVFVEALEISGHEELLVVGLQRDINCSTILHVSKLELYVGNWLRPRKTEWDSQFITVSVSAVDAAFNETMVTCKAVTVNGEVYEKLETIFVKEFTNRVETDGPPNPLLAGQSYNLTCTVTSDLAAEVKWKNSTGHELVRGESEQVILGHPVVVGMTTRLTLTFNYLLTSQRGNYSCVSIISKPLLIKEKQWIITVKIPPPESLYIKQQSNVTQVYPSDSVDLICHFNVSKAINTPFFVRVVWLREQEQVFESSEAHYLSLVDDDKGLQSFNSTLSFESLQVYQLRNYTCSVTIEPLDNSSTVSSDVSRKTAQINASLKVSIEIDYTPPDQYPDYAPHNYRAASSVILRCTTERASGSVSYRWSSTCRSCFASNRYSSTITENLLRPHDSGVHTCTVADAYGNSGSDSIPMNIVGAGIYVSLSTGYGGKQAAQPDNTYVNIDSYVASSSYRFIIYCCSNLTDLAYNVGSFTEPYGSTYTYSFNDFRISRHSAYYDGCIRLYGWKNIYSYMNYTTGVYTCNIPDSNGKSRHLNFALYSENTRNVPIISSFQQTGGSNSTLTLTCETTIAPPTEIMWQRNGRNLTIDGNIVQMMQTVTDRINSSFISNLSIFADPNNANGYYSVIVGNSQGYSNSSRLSIIGITLTASASTNTVGIGTSITLNCSSDLNRREILWYKGNVAISREIYSSFRELTVQPISTDSQGTYTCKVIGHNGFQTRNITLNVKVPNNWATVKISKLTDEDALHNHQYIMNCTLFSIQGMNIAPEVHWYHSNGSMVESGGRLRVDTTETNNTVTTLSVTFAPIRLENEGVYTCRAWINVPWMTVQPPVKYTTTNLVVMSQELFQIRMGPFSHCSTWEVSKALEIESSIKEAIEKAVQLGCNCDFNASAIHSGEFSCQTTTSDVIYRAILNGTGQQYPGNELLQHIENWVKSEGTLLYNKFRLRLSKMCPVHIQSFNEEECEGDRKTIVGRSESNIESQGLLFDSSTCYRFQSCGDGQSSKMK